MHLLQKQQQGNLLLAQRVVLPSQHHRQEHRQEHLVPHLHQ
jgi:hypothetical protein